MFEIIMLLAFFYAATCRLLPEANRDDKPGLPRKKHFGGKAHARTGEPVTNQTICQNKPDSHSNRKPVLHVQHDRSGIALVMNAKPGLNVSV